MISKNFLMNMCADLPKVTTIAPLNELIGTSASLMLTLICGLKKDQDGDMMLTVDFVKKATGLKDDAQTLALKKLASMGIIYTYFRKGTVPRRHVRFTENHKELISILINKRVELDAPKVRKSSSPTRDKALQSQANLGQQAGGFTDVQSGEKPLFQSGENPASKSGNPTVQSGEKPRFLYDKKRDKDNNKEKNKDDEATASNFRVAPTQETTHVGSTLLEGANLKPPHDSNLEKDARAGVRARAQEAFEKFRVRYQGSKRGHETELKTLMKHKDWMDVAMSLESALDVAIEQRAAKAAKKEFVPSWPNLQTYLNQRRWEESMQTVEDTSTGFNVSKYKSFQEAREAAQAEFLIDKNQEKRKRNMEIILNWKFPS